MQIDFSTLTARQSSKLLTSSILPRPIAWVTTIDADGRVNAAPFSFFNCLSTDPPLFALGIENRGPGTRKDTHQNLRINDEFVVHLVDEAMLARMNITATDFGPEIDELAEAGLTAVKSAVVKPPRIAEAPVAFECRTFHSIDLNDGKSIEIGRVLLMHINEGLLNAETFNVDSASLGLVSRMHNPGWYGRTGDVFQMRRMSPQDWFAAKRVSEG